MYTLYNDVKDGMSFLTPDFKSQIKVEMDSVYDQISKSGMKQCSRAYWAREIVGNTNFVEKMHQTISKYNRVVADCFCSNTDIKAAYNSALGNCINKEIPGVIIIHLEFRQRSLIFFVHLLID